MTRKQIVKITVGACIAWLLLIVPWMLITVLLAPFDLWKRLFSDTRDDVEREEEHRKIWVEILARQMEQNDGEPELRN